MHQDQTNTHQPINNRSYQPVTSCVVFAIHDAYKNQIKTYQATDTAGIMKQLADISNKKINGRICESVIDY